MEAHFTWHLVPLFVGAAISLVLMVLTWRYREHPSADWFLVILVTSFGWSITHSIQTASTDLATKELMHNVRFFFVPTITTAIFCFALSYTDRDRWLKPQYLLALFAIPALTQVMVWTDYAGLHDLLREEAWLTVEAGVYSIEVEYGAYFWVHAVHSYLMVLGATYLLLRWAINAWSTYRGQAIAFAVGTLTPVGANALFLSGATVVEYTAPAISFMMLALGWAMYRYQLLDVVPVARETVLDQMRDGVVVLNEEGKVVDLNTAATGLLETSEEAIGKHVDEVAPIALTERFGGLRAVTEEISLEMDDSHRDFVLTLTPIEKREDEYRGWVLVLQDVTTIKNRERQLEILNRVVRHDIQNDMNVVLGYAQTAEQRLDDGTFIRPIIQSSEHTIELTETVRNLLETITGEGELDLEPVSLLETIRLEVEKAKTTHESVTIEIDGEFDDEIDGEGDTDVRIWADGMLSSVFKNLLTNAIRHNDKPEPEVRISIDEQGDAVIVRVADNGPGIPDDRKTDVFGQGEKGLESPGSGVGLFLVHSLCEQYGGSVVVEDNDPEGAVFVLEFERYRADSEPPHVRT